MKKRLTSLILAASMLLVLPGCGAGEVPNTARQAASLPGDISRGRRSSMPQSKTRPDSPVPSLQGPCDRSLKSEVPCGSCLNWR